MYIVNAGEKARKGHPDELANALGTIFVGELVNRYGCTRADIDTAIGNAHVNAEGNVRYASGNNGTNYDAILKMTAKDVLKNAGYNERWLEFSPEAIAPTTKIKQQSDEIFNAQAGGYKHGDSRIRWGYSTKNTVSGLPLSTELLENIVYNVDTAFKKGELPIGADGKLQISMDDGTIYKITLAVQEDSSVSHDAIVRDVDKFVRSLVGGYIDDETILNINTSGSFVHGGPAYDKGQSNTKCDVYGQSFSSLGGGPYGKDLTKVEPVLQVQAHLLAEELLKSYPDRDECLVLLDASIGRPETDIKVWFNGTKKSDKKAEKTAKTELAHLLNPHNVIETHLSDKKLYNEIAEHGFFAGVLGYKYRPPFKI